MDLTWRQVFGLYERYWHRRQIDIAISVATNPFAQFSEGGENRFDERGNEVTVDATQMDTVQSLMHQGFPVKVVPRSEGQ